MMMWTLLLLIVSSTHCQDDLLIQTSDGPLLGGYRKTGSGEEYRSFQGVPFAAPPVGDLRFAAPQPVTRWSEPRDVSGWEDIKCTQYGYLYEGEVSVRGQEDCLYLNVYTPKNATKGDKLPVMFWIFGGYFQQGNNAWWAYGPDNWIERDVIMVQPNHRLGVFGFTSLGIPEAPGNQGLRDLVAALQWVQDNIEEFGGDKERVTIYGESSGSWAVSYLHLTPYANGLFSGVIMQSGTLFNPYWLWQTQEDALLLSGFMSTMFNCTDMSAQGQLECLRDLDRDTLQTAITWGTEETLNIQKILRPTGIIDGDFLPDIPTKLMERGEYNHVDVMIGMTKDEGLLQSVQFEINPDLYDAAKFMWDNLGPMFLFGRVLPYDRWPDDIEKTNIITQFYMGTLGRWNIDKEHFQNLTDMISDAYIWYGSHKHAEFAAANGDNVFQYQFQFKGPYGYLDSYGVDSTQYGVAHSDELWYLWNIYFGVYYVHQEEDAAKVSKSMLEMWVNFGSTGDPTPPGTDLESWSPVTADSHQYLIIDTEMRMEQSEYYNERMAIWDNTYEYPPGNTIPPQPWSSIKVAQSEDPFKRV